MHERHTAKRHRFLSCLVFGVMMEVIRSNKGGQKLIVEGFLYTKRNSTKERVYWRCANTAKFDCTGSIVTSVDVSTIYFSMCACNRPFEYLTQLPQISDGYSSKTVRARLLIGC